MTFLPAFRGQENPLHDDSSPRPHPVTAAHLFDGRPSRGIRRRLRRTKKAVSRLPSSWNTSSA